MADVWEEVVTTATVKTTELWATGGPVLRRSLAGIGRIDTTAGVAETGTGVSVFNVAALLLTLFMS